MLKTIATFFSFVFHPLFLPTYAIILIAWAAPYKLSGLDAETKLKLFGAIVVNTIFFPLLAIFIMKQLSLVKNFFLREREDRIIPYIALSLFYFWTFMVIRSLALDNMIIAFFLGASISVFACFFFNLFTKISAHTVGAGVFATLIVALAMTSPFNIEAALIAVIVIAGAIGSSRLYLQEHQQVEIYGGYLVGFISQMLAFRII